MPCIPFAVVATCLGVYDIQLTGAAGKVLEVLVVVNFLFCCLLSFCCSYLPARIGLQTSNLHAVNRSSWTWGLTFLRSKVVLPSWASGELYRQSFSFQFGSICQLQSGRASGIWWIVVIRKAILNQYLSHLSLRLTDQARHLLHPSYPRIR